MAFSNSDNRAQPSRSAPIQSSQLPALTSLRGIAAMWVVLYHYSAQCFPNLDPAQYTHLFHKGYLAVDLFFMLSGFVMTHVYHRAFSETVTSQPYWNFIFARIARVYPLHILVLLLFVATAVGFHLATGASPSLDDVPLRGPESVTAFVANVFMLQGLKAGQLSWNYPAWSISVEFVAYLLFPFALAAIWRLSGRAKVGVALSLLAVLVILAGLSKGNFDQWDGPITLARCLPEFIFGTLLYWVFRAAPADSWFARDSAALLVIAAIVVCLHADGPDLLITCLFGAFIPIAVLNTGTFAKCARTPALIWLGDVSYSLYLLHGFLQFSAGKVLAYFGVQNHANLSLGSSFVFMGLMVGTCLLAAHFTYFGVEIGCRQYLREILDAQIKKRRAKISKSAPSARRISAPA